MTDNGGSRDPWEESADSWFQPSENRYRKQSEYQDPQEGQQEGEEPVFPDSGGYAGVSSARPEMVEPYPEALGGPPPDAVSPTAEPPGAPPDLETPSHGGISYPGASPKTRQPSTRVPGEERSVPDTPGEECPGGEYPNIAASAEVPLPPEGAGTEGTAPEDSPWNPSSSGTPPPEEQHVQEADTWTPGTAEFEASAAPRWGDDPLGGGPVSDGYDDELSPGPRLAPRTGTDLGGELGTGSGNTWAFGRDDPRMPDVVREAEERRRAAAEEVPRYTDRDGRSNESVDALGQEDTGSNVLSSDPLTAIADMQSRARVGERRWDDQGQDGPAGDEVPPSGETSPPLGPDHNHEPVDGGVTQVFDPPTFEEKEHIDTPPSGVPSDLDPVPSHRHRSDFDDREDDRAGDGYVDHPEDPGEEERTRSHHVLAPDVEAERDHEYDDFSPADHGMPERPQRGSRRRRSISEDFPGFEDHPSGWGEEDSYPGYDSVDFLADTERGATVTLWLGVASLLPFVGVLAALPALLLTGPRAKREIRESRGQLDGLGLITAGTVLAVIGIVVTMISVAIAFIR